MKHLTKILKASIQLETKNMNTKLSDFPPEVLRAMLGAVIFKTENIKDLISKYKVYPDIWRMMIREGKIQEYQEELEWLRLAEIQIATEIGKQEVARKILEN